MNELNSIVLSTLDTSRVGLIAIHSNYSRKPMLTELQKRKMIKFFSMYDANCDSALVCQDFENLVKKLADLRNWGSRSSKYQGEKLDNI